MGNLRDKYTDEEWDKIQEDVKSNSGLGMFTQTTTLDDLLEFEKLNLDGFKKNNKTLIRDLIEEFKDWEYQWKCWNMDNLYPKPLDADEFSKSLSEKYNISEKC